MVRSSKTLRRDRLAVTLATLPETTGNVALVLPAGIVTAGGSDDFALLQQTVYRGLAAHD